MTCCVLYLRWQRNNARMAATASGRPMDAVPNSGRVGATSRVSNTTQQRGPKEFARQTSLYGILMFCGIFVCHDPFVFIKFVGKGKLGFAKGSAVPQSLPGGFSSQSKSAGFPGASSGGGGGGGNSTQGITGASSSAGFPGASARDRMLLFLLFLHLSLKHLVLYI
jgi:hypothetical protein